MSSSNINTEIVPSNVTSTGSVSFRDGNPVIQFIIGEQDRFLLGHSLRLVGNISIYKTPDGTGHGNIPDDADDLGVTPRLSTYSILDQIVLSSQKSKNVIEHVKHYGRYLSSYLPNISSILNSLLGYLVKVGELVVFP